jgi:VanZ family protein
MRPVSDPLSRLFVLSLVLTLLLAALVAYLMLQPPSPRVSRIQNLDKAAHFIAFFVLILPLASVLSARPAVAVAVGVAIVYGGVIEIVQPYVGRGAEWGDLLADALGAIAGAALGRWLRPRLIRRLAGPADGNAGSSRSPSSAAPP